MFKSYISLPIYGIPFLITEVLKPLTTGVDMSISPFIILKFCYKVNIYLGLISHDK